MEILSRGFQGYVVGLPLIGSLVLLSASGEFQITWWEIVLFMTLIGTASMLPIPDPRGGYITATGTLFYVLMSVHGPVASLIIAGSAYGAGAAVSRGWYPWRTIFNGAQMGASVGLAGLVFKLLGGFTGDLSWQRFLVPFLAASLVHQASNNFFVAFYFRQLRNVPLLSTWITDVGDFLWSNLLTLPTAALLTVLYVTVHPLTLLLYLASLPLQRRALLLYLQQRRLHNQAIDALTVAIDADFPQGKGHSRRVADAAMAIAREMKMPEVDIEAIELGSLLHDVGIIGLEDSVKAGVSEVQSDLARFREHVRIGAEIVRALPRRAIWEIVLFHHERFDGRGYPAGKSGREIPLPARIVAVAEVFESMLAGGFPYNEMGRTFDDAVAGIQSESGSAFDPQVVAGFTRAVASGAIKPSRGATRE
jgi:putative nucleotidyltransferase with HDIG domain